jgi:hypothetical protein
MNNLNISQFAPEKILEAVKTKEAVATVAIIAIVTICNSLFNSTNNNLI